MTFDRRSILRNGAFGAAAAAAGPLSAKAAKPGPGEMPNFLWFTSEDNFPIIGAYGDTLARTPTIDMLARKGVLFDRAYCVSPVCGPSRFSILTGMNPAACGSAEDFGSTDEVLPRSVRGYPEYFKDLGYYTANNQKKNYNSQFDYVMDMWDESSEQAHWNKRRPGQPFFSVFNTFTTHESCLFRPLDGKVTSDMVGQKIPPYLPDSPGVRRDFTTFYNAMEKMDGEFAARLKEIEDAGLADDTIVFYYSDNGGITPRGKRFCYDLGLRCALVVYVPPKWQHLSPWKPGTKVTDPVTFNDLMPTVLSMVGTPPPAHVHGLALFGPHRGERQKYAFGGRDRMDERYDLTRTVTDTRFRYIRNYNPHRPWGQHVEFMMQAAGYRDWEAMHLEGKLNAVQDRFWGEKPYEELYDVQTDPHMVENLADGPVHRAKLAELRSALDAQMLAINDNGLIPEACSAEGYVNSRAPGAYPIREAMRMAALAASRSSDLTPFLNGLRHENEIIRYWAAMGLLIAGEHAQPHMAAIKAAMLGDPSVATRIVLCEALVRQSNDHDALVTLGTIIDVEDDGPLRLQALAAIEYCGEKARPILPAIRRSAKEDHRGVRKIARHVIDKLEGTYDPRKIVKSPGGYIFADPEHDSAEGAGRLYD
ncbi:sulfatase-like hydrolase/transferase [Novosphingobium sp. PhB55]|uniref:sulfatase-like hydrolase/transferase n=1 Tax=unclassified Novosphingobium TaxID=2644732 RepID=UPI001066978C|nr:sulfatase-like hydrolase/transferase [Novosphingobium sp. PhB55]TDW63040.1 arylsulfatase A-like enzyme [Novosphingobium sp. PhB55]